MASTRSLRTALEERRGLLHGHGFVLSELGRPFDPDELGDVSAHHGVIDALHAFRDTGRTVTIVSNNSQAAVKAFLAVRRLEHLVTGVCSRQHPEPGLLKPNPFLLRRAIIERDATERRLRHDRGQRN